MAGKFEGKGKVNRLPSVRALAIQKVRKCVFITWGGADCKQSGCKLYEFCCQEVYSTYIFCNIKIIKHLILDYLLCNMFLKEVQCRTCNIIII